MSLLINNIEIKTAKLTSYALNKYVHIYKEKYKYKRSLFILLLYY